MKDPKALFPILFGSSWLGNIFLTILAFYLAFSQSGPLTPFTLFTVAICILSGNLLPISAYWLFTRYRQAELQAEAAEAAVRVRDALRRSEEVMGRLDEAEGALAKAILIARQVPDRIGSRFEALESLAARLDTLELDSFTESLEGQGTALESLGKEAVAIQSAIKDLKSGLDKLPKTVGGLIEKAIPEPAARAPDDSEVSFDERLDLVFESLEGIQDSLDGLLQRMAEIQAAGGAAVPAKVDAEVDSDPDPDNDPDPDIEKDSDQGGEGALQAEMPLDGHPAGPPAGRTIIGKRMVHLTVHAMVGISNKLTIRGDEPWLSWDSGQLMSLVGIGEFAWELDDLKEPIEVAVLLNDEIEAEGGRITLTPGKPVQVNLTFPER